MQRGKYWSIRSLLFAFHFRYKTLQLLHLSHHYYTGRMRLWEVSTSLNFPCESQKIGMSDDVRWPRPTRPGGRPYLQPPTQGTSRKHIISILSPSKQILSLISFYMASISMYFLIIILMFYFPSGSLTVCLAKWKMYTYNLEINQCQDVILVKSYLWGVGEMLEGDWDAHCLSAILGDEPFSSWSLNKSHICDILKSWI